MDLVHTPEGGKIGPLQAAMLAIALVLPSALLYVPSLHLVLDEAGRDAWISVLLATALAMPLEALLWQLATRHPGRTFMQVLEIEWGPWVGQAVGALYVLGIVVHTGLLLRAFSEAVGLTILPNTPVLVIAVAQMAVAIFAARRGIEVIARVNQVATPLMLVSLLALFGLAWSDFRWHRLPPFFQTPTEEILRGALWPLGWFVQIRILVQIAVPFVQGPRRASGPLLLAMAVTGLFMVAGVLVSLGVLGPYVTEHSIGVMEKVAREIRPIEFLSRTEALYTFFWQAASFVGVTAFLYAGTLSAAQLFSLRSYPPLAAPLGLLVVLVGSFFFRSLTDLIEFARQVFPVYALLLGGAIPLLLLAFSFRSRPVGR